MLEAVLNRFIMSVKQWNIRDYASVKELKCPCHGIMFSLDTGNLLPAGKAQQVHKYSKCLNTTIEPGVILLKVQAYINLLQDFALSRIQGS